MGLIRALGLIFLLAILAAVGMAGCSSAPPKPTPAALATAVPTPAATPVPPTATPKPPTATPTPPPPSPTPGGAVALLAEVQRNHQNAKSARGQMEISIAAYQLGKPQSVSMVMDFEFSDPDLHLKMSGSNLPATQQVEAMVVGDITYIKVENQWMALPKAAPATQRGKLDPLGVEQLQSYLDGSSGAKLEGRRTVRGEECEVVSFALSPEKLRELAAMRGQVAVGSSTNVDMVTDSLKAEVAIGTKDRLIRQMVFEIGGYEKQRPQEPFKIRFTVTLWDLNAPDIVVKAPDPAELMSLEPRSRPSPTPTPVPVPLHAYRSDVAPVVDGVVAPGEGWEKADAVRGPYADGNIEIKALHDGKNLYLLLSWDDARYKKAEGLSLFFEDGGTLPQKKLDGVNDDEKYVGVSGLPDGYRDANWSAGWSVSEQADGRMAGRYGAGKMVVEWSGPLNSGTLQDISVVSDETLGFAVVNWSDGIAGSRGAWPARADPYKPETWSRLVVHIQETHP